MKTYANHTCIVTASDYAGSNRVDLYKMRSSHIPPFESFYKFLIKAFPAWAWEYNDGTDWNTNDETQFVEYIAYTSISNKSNYIVATYRAF